MKFIPHDYQRYCINRMITDPALGLFLDMGLGKTVITLTAVNDLRYNRFEVGKTLVIAPKKVAEDTWTREAGKWDHLKLLRIIPVLGSREKRIKALNTPGDVYVLSRDNVQWLVDHYRNAWPFDTVIIDELSSFKNPQAKRFKSLCLVRNHIRRIYGLTGTPAPNGLLDLWSQIYLLDQGQRLGTRIGQYRDEYFSPASRNRDTIFSYVPLPGADQAIQQQIADICISLQAKDYLQLPERIDNIIHVRLNAKEQAAYEKFEREMLLEVDEATLDAGSAAVLSGKLLQFCNGAVYDNDKNAVEVHGEKLEAFKEIAEGSQGKPILVFYNFQHDKSRIIKCLPKGLRVAELKGPGVISQWNERKIDVLLAHPASAAYGLNLQAGGNIIVWFGLNWSLELYQQANARLHRQGQTDNVIIHHLIVSGCMDEDVMAALQNKQVTQDSLLTALKARIAKVKEKVS
uniref:DEAD/DEAH box helicase n=1 Tax=Enterocloster clostridioformis TaxID=1531 RepID=UPI00266C1A98|nr:DEAD/DEAH box helicase [Enterocloster clostridioformis]